ncbi:hypothetical protein PSE10B_23280 [Pseudomonas amygdali pv. eriobotryae]|nr:hypothetical protein PSE10B_23280 [Pseudomonas amygdali pv. eriobotryae]
MRVSKEQVDDRVDHPQRTEHAQLDGGYVRIVEDGIGLCHDPFAIEHAKITDIYSVLHGERSNRRSGVTALGEQGFYIGLHTGTATRVVAGEAKDNGAGAIDIHGARAYH